MCCRCCSETQQKIWVFGLGALFLISGLVLTICWPSYAEDILYKTLALKDGGITYKKWSITPIPVYMHMYLFNWTNPEQVRVKGVKPHFDRVGPYVYRESKIKQNITWYPNNTVSFKPERTWHFQRDLSGGSQEDLITAPHLPSITAAKIFKNWHPIPRKIVNFALNREGGRLAVTQSVRKWTFEGFYDDLLDLVERLHSPILGIDENEFAYFYKHNGSKDNEGTFSMYTGKGNLYNMGELKYWNNLNHTKYWDGECGRVNGSTGEVWAPKKNWHDPVSIFYSDARRFLNIYPQSNETYCGVKVRRYTSTELTFDSGHRTEDTKCFCLRGKECPKAGVVDFSPPSKRTPLYISHPHFHMADPIFRENTTGLSPDPEKHIVTVLLEPKLGIPLYVDGRVFVSVLVKKDDNMDLLKDLAWNFYAPLFTIQVKATVTDDLLREVKFILNLPKLGQYLGVAFTTIGIIVIGVGIYVTMKNKWHKN